MKKIIFIFIIAFTAKIAHAQNAIFLKEGTIEFEEKLNMYKQIETDNWWGEQFADFYKKNMPQFKTTYFNLYFKDEKTLYKPGRENPENSKMRMWGGVSEDNIVYTDFTTDQSIAQKSVFDAVFLITDSIRKINWKITDETREIAGFQCRRANALIMDSVYIVAFYTDAILTPGGPESVSGLPGMILGLAVPNKHVTWFATKVTTQSIPDKEMLPPKGGKKLNNKMVLTTLKDAFKDWGKNAVKYIEQLMF
jgi:GLPGLI family protein